MSKSPTNRASPGSPHLRTRLHGALTPTVLLLALLALTAGLRWYRFETFPPGLWYDEAYYLREAQALVQDGDFQMYYPDTPGEPAFTWLTAGALWLGANHLATRWVSTSASILSIAVLFFSTRDMVRAEGKSAEWLALLSGAGLAANYAYLLNSRMGWEVPVSVSGYILTVWLFWRSLRDGSRSDAVLAGVALGASQYVWVGARLLPLVLFMVLIGWQASAGDDHRHRRARSVGTTVFAAVLTSVPLLVCFIRNPAWFFVKLQAAGSPQTVLPNLRKSLAGWLFIGGAGLHDLPGRPILDPAMGVLLVTGLLSCVQRLRRPNHAVWVAWLVGTLPTGVLADPAPSFYRMMAAVPATAVICALGARHLWTWIKHARPDLRVLTTILVLGLYSASAVCSVHDYFITWANWPQLPRVMDVWKWLAAEAILEAPEPDAVLSTIPDNLEYALSYAVHSRVGTPVRSSDGAHCLVYPVSTASRVRFISVLGYEHRSLERLRKLFPSGQEIIDPVYSGGPPYFVEFAVPPGADVPVLGQLKEPVKFEHIALSGVSIPMAVAVKETWLPVSLTWRPLEPTAANFKVYVHLVPVDETRGTAWPRPQEDSIPCETTEPTWKWRPGEYILDEHRLELPSNLPLGEYYVTVGLYDADTQERLEASGPGLVTHHEEPVVGLVKVSAS
jgi:hypothetical protein